MRRMRFSFSGRITFVICFIPTFISIVVLLYHSNFKNSQGIPESESWKQRLVYESRHATVIGIENNSNKFLTIGIPTVYRKENYLKQTLQGFINQSTEEERKYVTILIHLGDLDLARRKSQLQLITQNFQPYITSGFIQIISSTKLSHDYEYDGIYPNLNLTTERNTYNDPIGRVQWRSKQVIDFAFLLSYASSVNISEYFMVLEDDVEPSPQFITTIRDYINTRTHPWIALEFTEFIAIGLCFHTSSLSDLAQFLLLFYKDQPVDLLMRQFIKMQVPDNFSVKRKIPSVFQHFGIKSTLNNKTQKIYDFSFEISRRKIENTNPPALLNTTMEVYEECIPQNAYSSTPGFFWGIPSTNKTEYINIIFKSSPPLPITQIVIFTGGIFQDPKHINAPGVWKDFIKTGHLEFSSESSCSNFSKLEDFVNGKIDVTLFMSIQMSCLQIVIPPNINSSWILVSEIEIFIEQDMNSK